MRTDYRYLYLWNYPTPDTATDPHFWIDDEEPENDPGDYPEESDR